MQYNQYQDLCDNRPNVVYSILRSNLIFLNKCRRNFYTIQQTDEGKQERADSVGCSDIWTDKG